MQADLLKKYFDQVLKANSGSNTYYFYFVHQLIKIASTIPGVANWL